MSYKVEFKLAPAPDIEKIVSEELFKAATKTQDAWRDNLQEGIGATGEHGRPYVYTGESINRTNVYPELPGYDTYEVIGDTEQHFIAEFGREPSDTLPPYEPISTWARIKGLEPYEGQTWDAMVMNIRRHIATNGLKAFAPGLLAFETVIPTVERSIKSRFKEELETMEDSKR